MEQETRLLEAARIIVRDSLAISGRDTFVILTNPQPDTMAISRALYAEGEKTGAEVTLVVQPEKSQLDYANLAALGALESGPTVCASISAGKLGKDRAHTQKPFVGKDGREIDHIFDYLMEETKSLRAIWTPGITVDMFCRTACIDYALLRKRCEAICRVFEGADSVRVTAPGGTDITVPVAGRKAFCDDGNFRAGGSGGNIPAGEVYISPLPRKAEGVIVFDGSLSMAAGPDIITEEPVRVVYRAGYAAEISGGREAEALRAAVASGEEEAEKRLREGLIPEEKAAAYKRNARSLGELGIGLNPAATISGNMLEDEKALHTCHFAIGANYDNDADALIHLDCLVKKPTIRVFYKDKAPVTVEEDGTLAPWIPSST